jgi:DNA polymerase-3 subunit beta
MKFTCEKLRLTEAVMNVSRVIPAKSSIPTLEGIQIKAYGEKLKLTGYDMEAGIKTSIDASIQEEGEIVLSARLFADILRKLAGEEVVISSDEKNLTLIKSGLSEFNVIGSPSEEYPELPEIEKAKAAEIPKDILRSMIDQTLFAVATTDAKPIHTGSLFEQKDGVLNVVSVDGFRLALRSEKLLSDDELKFVVPGKVLSEISKLLAGEEESVASLMVSKRHIVFQIGNYSVISRLLEGEFLDYKNSIPAGSVSSLRINTRMFMESVERVSLLISDRLRSPLRVTFESGKIAINCATAIGKSHDEIACEFTGEKVEMGFNNKYLLEALKAADTDEVRIEISGPLSPIKILPPEGEDFLFLVLPVRLRNDS